MEFKSVLSRKPVSEICASQDSPDRRLSKVLVPFSIAAMGIGAIIGAGIFVLTVTAAALSEFLPVSGSSYTSTYAPLGELAAWVIGWDLILEYAMGGATVAVGWSGYFNSLLGLAGIGLDPRLVAATGQAVTLADGTTAAAIANLPAAAIVVLITVLLVLGTRESARLNNVMVAVKLTLLLAFVVLGAFHFPSP